MTLHPLARLCLVPLAVLSAPAFATPVDVSNAGYWLETVGTNTIGLAGGGSAAGVVTTLFVASTSPNGNQGTTASASYAGVATNAPTFDGVTTWARRVLNPSSAQLQPLTVTFQNGLDTATFVGRSLVGVTPVPLAQSLAVDPGASVFSPTVSWVLPSGAGFEIDAVQLVFYSNTTNLEIGTRALLSSSATSFTFGGMLPAGLDLTVNVRLIDYVNNDAPFSESNILAESRAYVNYSVPAVPEPATTVLLSVGVGALALVVRRRRGASGDAA